MLMVAQRSITALPKGGHAHEWARSTSCWSPDEQRIVELPGLLDGLDDSSLSQNVFQAAGARAKQSSCPCLANNRIGMK